MNYKKQYTVNKAKSKDNFFHKKIKKGKDFSKKPAIKKTAFSIRYLKMAKNVRHTLSEILGQEQRGLNLQYLIEYLLKKDVIPTNYVDFNSGGRLFGMRMFIDESGYGCYWKVLKINYNRLAEKILNINSNHIIKKLQNGKCLIFIKCDTYCTRIQTSERVYFRI